MKVVDMHCDTISELYERKQRGEEASIWNNQLHLDLQKMVQGDYLLQNFALFTRLSREERPFEYCMKLVDTFYTQLEPYANLIGVVRSYEDIERNKKEGRMSALLTVEEGGVCQGELAFLRDLYRIGVRMMTLTWNFANELGYPARSVLDSDRNRTNEDGRRGLTPKGIEFVSEMERMGMIIDVSHLSDDGFWDVIHYTGKPFAASHSNCRQLACHERNLTDDQIRALADRGGVIGINYCSSFLHDWDQEEEPLSRISDMVSHMEHMKKIGGIGCIGLGSDFDGITGSLELKDASHLPRLASAMENAGFTSSEIEAVFYKNVLRVYQEILK